MSAYQNQVPEPGITSAQNARAREGLAAGAEVEPPDPRLEQCDLATASGPMTPAEVHTALCARLLATELWWWVDRARSDLGRDLEGEELRLALDRCESKTGAIGPGTPAVAVDAIRRRLLGPPRGLLLAELVAPTPSRAAAGSQAPRAVSAASSSLWDEVYQREEEEARERHAASG